MDKSPDAFRTISEVAEWLGIQAHVLRFWESKFSQVKPVKRAGGRRYYRPSDMQLIGGIKTLLHDDGLTIKGVQKILREQGVVHVTALSPPLDEMAGGDAQPSEESATVVAFSSRKAAADRAAAEPADPPAEADAQAGAAPETETSPEPETAAPETTPEAAPEPEEAAAPEPEPEAEPEAEPEPERPTLPSFLSRPEPQAPRPDSIEAPDPPADDEMPYAAGALARLSGLSRLDLDHADTIAPLVAELRAWRDRVAGAGRG